MSTFRLSFFFILTIISSFCFGQKQHKIEFSVSLTHDGIPIEDSITVDFDFNKFVKENNFDYSEKKVLLRLVKTNDTLSYFRLYDCIIHDDGSQRYLEEESYLSRILADKIFIIYFNQSLNDPDYNDRLTGWFNFYITMPKKQE